jgi:hypothetical protein
MAYHDWWATWGVRRWPSLTSECGWSRRFSITSGLLKCTPGRNASPEPYWVSLCSVYLFTIHLTMLPVSRAVWHGMVDWLVNNDLERMWPNARHLLGGTEKNRMARLWAWDLRYKKGAGGCFVCRPVCARRDQFYRAIHVSCVCPSLAKFYMNYPIFIKPSGHINAPWCYISHL